MTREELFSQIKEGKEEAICPCCGSDSLSGANGFMEKEKAVSITCRCLDCNAVVGKVYAKRPASYPGAFDLAYAYSRGIDCEEEVEVDI